MTQTKQKAMTKDGKELQLTVTYLGKKPKAEPAKKPEPQKA